MIRFNLMVKKEKTCYKMWGYAKCSVWTSLGPTPLDS